MPLAGRLDGDLRTDWHAVWSTPTLCLGQRWHPWHTQYAEGGWLAAILPQIWAKTVLLCQDPCCARLRRAAQPPRTISASPARDSIDAVGKR